jgi:antitoxin ParD1/3/4
MTTMNISLPEGMKGFVDAQVAQRGFGTGSEYVRSLIRLEQERQEMRQWLLQAAQTPVAGEANDSYFNQVRDRIRQE